MAIKTVGVFTVPRGEKLGRPNHDAADLIYDIRENALYANTYHNPRLLISASSGVGNGSISSEFSATTTTTTSAQTTIQTFAIPTNTIYLAESRIIARKTAGSGSGTTGDANIYIITVAVKNVSGTLSIVGTIQNDFTAEDISGPDATFLISGTNLLVRVSGAINDTLSWLITTRITQLT